MTTWDQLVAEERLLFDRLTELGGEEYRIHTRLREIAAKKDLVMLHRLVGVPGGVTVAPVSVGTPWINGPGTLVSIRHDYHATVDLDVYGHRSVDVRVTPVVPRVALDGALPGGDS